MIGYFLVDEVNKARGIFNTFAQREVIPDSHCYSIMINGSSKINMIDETVNLFEEMHPWT